MQNSPVKKIITLSSKKRRYQSLPFVLHASPSLLQLLSAQQLENILRYLCLVDLFRFYNVFYHSKKTKDLAKTIIKFIARNQRIYSAFQLKEFFGSIVIKGNRFRSRWRRNTICGNDYSDSIRLDVERTSVWFCRNTQQINNMRSYVWRILNRLCGSNSHYGYLQGFHSIIRAMFQSRLSQNQAFLLGSYLLKEMKLGFYYENKVEKMREICYVLDVYIYNTVPDVHYCLKQSDLTAQCYAISWFVTLFSNILPLPTLNRLWVLFIIKGWKAIIKFALALICTFRESILSQSQCDLPQYLMQLPSLVNIFTQKTVWQLYSSIKVTKSMIKYLSRRMDSVQSDRQISILQLKNMKDASQKMETEPNVHARASFPSYSNGLCCERINSSASFPYCAQF